MLHRRLSLPITFEQRIGEKLGRTHRSDYLRFAMKLGLLEAD
jgi:hypothetical protein